MYEIENCDCIIENKTLDVIYYIIIIDELKIEEKK